MSKFKEGDRVQMTAIARKTFSSRRSFLGTVVGGSRDHKLIRVLADKYKTVQQFSASFWEPAPPAMTLREIAEQIAGLLFVNDRGDQAQRLMLAGPEGQNYDGWTRAGVVDQIEEALKQRPEFIDEPKEDGNHAERSARESAGPAPVPGVR